MRRTAQRGFTLVEVMLALGILFGALVALVFTTAQNMRRTVDDEMRGVATNLARHQMYELEEELLREGFQELDQELDGDFSDQGWPDVEWEATIAKIELPPLATAQGLAGEAAEGAEGEGGEGAGGAGDSPLGGMLGMLGGGMGGDAGAGFIQSQFELFTQILEQSIRRVDLTVTYEVMGEEKSLSVSAYFTNPSAIDQVISLGGGGSAGGGGGGGGGGDRDTGGGGDGPPRRPEIK